MFLAPDRESFDSLQHAPLQTGDTPEFGPGQYDSEEDIKRKPQAELQGTEPRNPELEGVCLHRGQGKNGEPENRGALGLQNKDETQLPCGSFRCGDPDCTTCCYISDGRTTYTFFPTNEECPIESNLSCDTKNVIYMIQCNRCKLQYIGQTRQSLKEGFNQHRRPIMNPKASSYNHSAVVKHFLRSPDHTAQMQLIPMEKISSDLDSIRRARKAFLIQKGKTTHPYGLN